MSECQLNKRTNISLMYKLENYLYGKWVQGDGEGQTLFNAVSGEAVATATSKGLNFQEILRFGRETGTRNLSRMTFHERGLMLRALALHLQKHLDKFYEISYKTGATKADSWIDIEGGIGNLFSYASLRRKFPDETFCLDGEPHQLGKADSFMGTAYTCS